VRQDGNKKYENEARDAFDIRQGGKVVAHVAKSRAKSSNIRCLVENRDTLNSPDYRQRSEEASKSSSRRYGETKCGWMSGKFAGG
jgi:hypothetical protein